jgi:hypothetical protein
MDTPQEESGEAGKARKMLGAWGMLGLLKAMEKGAETQDEPQIRTGNPRIRHLAELALDLATEDQTDDQAVRTLVDAAGRWHRDLSKAAAFVRFAGDAKIYRRSDRANRLLLAAFNGEPVEPLPPELDEWFARIDEIRLVPVEVSFPTLVALQPALGELEARFSPRTVDDADREALWNELIDSIKPIVGPDAAADDPLLLTRTAWNVARLYLAVRVGLLETVDYSDD